MGSVLKVTDRLEEQNDHILLSHHIILWNKHDSCGFETRTTASSQLTTVHWAIIWSYAVSKKVIYDSSSKLWVLYYPHSLVIVFWAYIINWLWYPADLWSCSANFFFCHFANNNTHWISWLWIYNHVVCLTTMVIHLTTVVKMVLKLNGGLM